MSLLLEMERFVSLKIIFLFKLIFLAELHNRKSISSPTQLTTSLRRRSKENLELSKRIQALEDKVIMKEDLEENREREDQEEKKEKEDLEEKMAIDHLEDKREKDNLEDKMDKEDLEEIMIESLDLNKDKIEDLEEIIITSQRLNGLKLAQLNPEKKI